MTLLQRTAPDAALARVFGVLESLLLLTVGLGAVIAPVLLSALGVRWTLVLAGVLLPLLVVPAWPALRQLDRQTAGESRRVARLRAVPFLALLPEATVGQLAQAAAEVRMAAGEEIVREGDSGDRFYVVDSGTVDVVAGGARLATLGPGEYFGEIALLHDVPRTATVVAREDGVLLTLARDAFIPAVAGYAPSLASAKAVAGLRLGPVRAGIVRA